MSDLIKLRSGVRPFEDFWVSASTVVLIEPVAFSYGGSANSRITLESGETRKCCETAPEIAQLIAEAHSHVAATE